MEMEAHLFFSEVAALDRISYRKHPLIGSDFHKTYSYPKGCSSPIFFVHI
jgi:hypothetical protein